MMSADAFLNPSLFPDGGGRGPQGPDSRRLHEPWLLFSKVGVSQFSKVGVSQTGHAYFQSYFL